MNSCKTANAAGQAMPKVVNGFGFGQLNNGLDHRQDVPCAMVHFAGEQMLACLCTLAIGNVDEGRNSAPWITIFVKQWTRIAENIYLSTVG
jgi:hypothetical protein